VAALEKAALPAPTLTIGKIVDRLGFIISSEKLAALGFPATAQRNSRLYQEADFPRICAAVAEHVLEVGGRYN
jgi:hypothetical protein